MCRYLLGCMPCRRGKVDFERNITPPVAIGGSYVKLYRQLDQFGRLRSNTAASNDSKISTVSQGKLTMTRLMSMHIATMSLR